MIMPWHPSLDEYNPTPEEEILEDEVMDMEDEEDRSREETLLDEAHVAKEYEQWYVSLSPTERETHDQYLASLSLAGEALPPITEPKFYGEHGDVFPEGASLDEILPVPPEES